MTEPGGLTLWSRSIRTPLRAFLRTETGSAALLLAATVAALAWANADRSSYESVWHKTLLIQLGGHGIAMDLRSWINTGLMTFFFFVVGLEARREFDMGELRERRRVTVPLLAGIGGMVVPVLIFLAFNAGHSSAHGWGAAMSTDTAFALALLAFVGPRFPDRLLAFVLTTVVVDDLVALLVIATVYASNVSVGALLAALGIYAVVLVVRAAEVHAGLVYLALGTLLWFALHRSGIEPVVAGIAMGLLTYAYPARRADLEQATALFRRFREQPTPALARSARSGLEAAISPNERLQELFHPWTSYAIVPLFALANVGIGLNGSFLGHAFTSPVTLGIMLGLALGKPAGIAGTSWLVTRLSGGRLRPPVGWASVLGTGAVAGIGFTVSLLIATLAFHGRQLDEAKLGVLAAALLASTLGWAIFRATALLPRPLRARALLGTTETIVDLADPVDPERDHIRGDADAPVTIVEYADFECPYCGRAEPILREVLAGFGHDVRYVWRHLPLEHVHPHAQLAAEAAEAAAAQGAFWEMHNLLFEHQDALEPRDLLAYAEQLGLDVERFRTELREHEHARRVAEDVDGAELSDVSGTPTFFVNGRRHHGVYDVETLSAAVRAAGARATIG